MIHTGSKKRIKSILYYTIPLFIGMAFMFVYVFGGNPDYGENDDTIMNLIAAGAYGPDTQHLVFIKLVLGYLLKCLYFVLPHINCYWWFFVLLNFISVYFIILQFTENRKTSVSILSAVLVNFILGYSFYGTMQFTQNASLYAITGYVMLYKAFTSDDRKKIVKMIFSGLFIIMSYLTRTDCLMMVSPFALVLCGAMFIKCDSHKERVKWLKQLFIWCVCVILIIVGCAVVEKIGYSSEEWQYYLALNKLRPHFADYGHMRIEDAAVLGITDNAITLFRKFEYGDLNVWSYDRMQQLLTMYKDNTPFPLGKTWVMMTCRTVMEQIKWGNIYAVLWIGLWIAAIRRRKLVEQLLLLGLSILVFMEYWYMLAFLRPAWRAEMGIWLAVVIFSACFMYGNGSSDVEKEKSLMDCIVTYLGLAFVVIIIVCDLSYFCKTNRIEEDNRCPGYDFLRATESDDVFYVRQEEFNSTVRSNVESILDIDKDYEGLYANSCSLGGWITSSPVALYYPAKRGINNPVTSLWESENVHQYICDYYGEYDLDMQYEGSVAGIDTWSFVCRQK